MKKITLITLAILFVGFSFANKAFAHATPITYEPEASAVMEKTPEIVRIRFSERIDPPASNITVFAPDGSEVDDNNPKVDPVDSHIYSVGVQTDKPGTYTVSWQVVSADDGHFTKGAYSFSVSTVSNNNIAPEQSSVVFLSKTNEGLVTSIELVGQGLLWGILLVLSLFWRRLNPTYHIGKFKKYFSALLILGAFFILLGSLAYIAIKSQDLGQLRSLAFLPSLKLFIATSAGKFAIYRAILALVFLSVFAFTRNKIFKATQFSVIEILLLIISILIAVARVASSHAVASHFLPPLTIFDHVIHMIFKGLWVGLVLAVSALLLPAILKIKELNLLFPMLNRLSKILTWIFGIVGLTGAYIVWLDLKDIANIQTTDWGMRFVILSTFGGILLLARLYNQLFVEWGVIKAAKSSDQSKITSILSSLKISYPLEALVGISLLIATGFIMITTPPVWNKNTFHESFENQGMVVELREHPSETNYLKITTKPFNNERVKHLVVTLTNREKGIGPIVADIEKRSDTSFVISKNQLSPAGQWKIDIAVQKNQGYDATGAFELNYPRDIDAGRLEQNQRTFGLFEWIVIIHAVGILFFVVILLGINRYLLQQFDGQVKNKNITTQGNLTLNKKYILIWPFAALTLITLWFVTPIAIKGDFQRECEKQGNLWHSMLPTRAGVPASQISTVGCMMGNGQYHITDKEEYEYFVRPVEVQANLITQPSDLKVGMPSTLTFSLKDNSGEPIRELSIEHERLIHIMIIGQDFTVFSHIHPDDKSPITYEMKQAATFPIVYTFPKAGKYLVALDFVVKAQHFSKQFMLDVAGTPKMTQAVPDFTRRKSFNDYEITLSSPSNLLAGRMETLSYHVVKDGKPVTDLVPYLGAAMHIAVVKNDLSKFIHAHGEVHLSGQTVPKNTGTHYHPAPPKQFGPNVEAHLVFLEKGIYHIFGEIKHEGRIILINFAVRVEE